MLFEKFRFIRSEAMVTIKDISNKLGISISSVSKALNGATDISQRTRERVIEIANEMGYVKRSMTSSKSNLKFGIIVDQNCSEYDKILNYDIIQGFNNKSLSEGNEVLIVSLKENIKKSNLETVIKINNLSGAILIISNISDTIRKSILKMTYPFVIVNNYLSIDKQNIGYVGIDMVEGMRKVVNYFISCGHKDISFVNTRCNDAFYQDKLVGYIASLTSYGINYDPQNVLNIPDEDYEDEIMSFVKSRKPTAICADNDLTAYKVLNVLVRNGYRVPGDVSIVGFDNNFVSYFSNPSISTVTYDRNELGVKAYVALNNILNGNSINRMQIKSEILERGSSRV